MTRTAAAAPPEQRRHDGDDHDHEGHGHSHGLVDPSIKRSREGLRVVGISLALLAVTAVAQGAIYVATGSIALLADLIHNAGDALTAFPLAVAFLLRSERPERGAGLAVVLAILVSAITAGVNESPCSIVDTPARTARSMPNGKRACAATSRPELRAASTAAASSLGVNVASVSPSGPQPASAYTLIQVAPCLI